MPPLSGKVGRVFQAYEGLFVRCFRLGVFARKGKGSSAEEDGGHPRAALSARMSPHRVIPRRVARLRSPLPFHPVSLLRSSARAEHSCIARHAQHSNGGSCLRGKGKTYWPSCWRISPCWTAWVMANCAVRFEHWLRCIISWRNWL
jgi:hypothetical protein